MEKNELRIKYKSLRKEITSVIADEKSLAIANRIISLPIWEGTYYHIFLPIEKHREIETSFILNILQGKDKEVVLPKSNLEDGSMTHYLLTDSTVIRPNRWGIPEPENGLRVAPSDIDVVFVPLLAFDVSGNRVGYGKGYYDRFLAECRRDTLKIGLSFYGAEPAIGDTDPNDITLDYCITPEKVYSFS
ncbi:5-formyltetrahydrofolate cyclo-ligase [Sinomicrobium soli]|uniref:5-formyltetrahydrofolate cyclo-ligase n=1 Tax=Sinomicrobium sp. N-1-3-6 TaxID=2219864 RepID=UPI000DCE65A4|nr:5-formyltetrahydrofolate cyclo-ligase [Sinomicrobium sp. N-1-3-6]RAV29516.1 5-formyltetrahydrofolate cyclo-ligase [Sinomicrobium sp. N-1-3-6]